VTICLRQKPYTRRTVICVVLKIGETLVIITSEIDLSVGSATALGVLVALLTLKGVGFSADQPCAGQWHLERRSSKV
jgi:ribose/xylose/arabinose/galactoside ABC-type transport system permease subunit